MTELEIILTLVVLCLIFPVNGDDRSNLYP